MNKKINSPTVPSESVEWAERLAKARAQRELMKDNRNPSEEKTEKFYQAKIGKSTISADSKQVADLEEIVSVDDVLQTANLNDRMEMARLRHVQILALRGAASGGKTAVSADQAPLKHKNTFRAAIGKKPAEPKPLVPEVTQTTDEPSILSTHETALPDEKRKRSLAAILLSGGILALLVAAFIPGQGRDFVTLLLGRVAGNPGVGLQTNSIPVGTSNIAVENIDGNVFTEGVSPLLPTFSQVSAAIETRNGDLIIPSDLIRSNARIKEYSRLLKPGPDPAPADLIGLNVPEYTPSNREFPSAGYDKNSLSTDDGNSVASVPYVTDSMTSTLTSVLTLGDAEVAVARNLDPLLQLPKRAAQIGNISEGTAVPIVVRDKEILRIGDVNVSVAQPVMINEIPAGGSVGISNFVDNYTGLGPNVVSDLPPPKIDVYFASLPPLPELTPAAKPQLIISNLQINSPSSLSEETINGVIAVFEEAGLIVRASRKVDFNIRNTNVRFYHPQDKEAAQLVSDAIGGIARDFTDFRPLPPLGTVEVWLAGDSAARSNARRQGTQPAPRSTRQEDPALIQLRNRLVESLKRGDHL